LSDNTITRVEGLSADVNPNDANWAILDLTDLSLTA
jgi:hypothetical protein